MTSPSRARSFAMKSLNAAGTREVLFSAYTPGERDYSALVSRMKEAGVEVMYIGGYYTEAGLILRQEAPSSIDFQRCCDPTNSRRGSTRETAMG